MARLRYASSILLFVFLLSACVPATPTVQPASPTTPPSQDTPTLPASPTAGETAAPAQTPAGTWIQLSPQSANPGEKVTIDGYLPGGPDAAGAQGQENLLHANVCWQGCLEGRSSRARRSNGPLKRPAVFKSTSPSRLYPGWAGWAASRGGRSVQRWTFQRLGPDLQGCAIRPAQAEAVLAVKSAAPTGCPNEACALLQLDPAQGQAGANIQVKGWAPLDEIIGDLAFGYSLVLLPEAGQSGGSQPVELAPPNQDLDGALSGSFVVPQSLPGLGTLEPGKYTLALQAARFGGQNIVLAPTAFSIGQASAWNDLKPGKPLWIEPSASLTTSLLAVDPAKAGRFADRDAGSLRVTENGGKSWTAVPTLAVAQAAEAAGYPLSADMPGTPL